MGSNKECYKKFNIKRKKIFKIYDNKLKELKKITLLPKNNWSKNSYWLYTILIKNINRKIRDKLIINMQNKGIECRPGFYSLSLMKPFKKYSKGSYLISNDLSERSLSLPTTNINRQQQNFIIKTFVAELKKINI